MIDFMQVQTSFRCTTRYITIPYTLYKVVRLIVSYIGSLIDKNELFLYTFFVNNMFFSFLGYSLNEIKDTVFEMNNMLHNQKSDLCAVRQKYLHK